MEFYQIALLALITLFHLSLIWYVRCINLTSRHLEDMAALIAEQDDFVILFRQYWKVSYDKHVLALFFFRDPWKLYSKEIQDIMRGQNEV